MGLGIQKFTPRRHCDWLKRQSQRATHSYSHTHRQRDSHSHRLSERMRFSSHTAEVLFSSLLFSSRTNNNACRGSAAPGKTITEIVCPLCARNQCNFRENGQKRTTHREIESVRGSEREREMGAHSVGVRVQQARSKRGRCRKKMGAEQPKTTNKAEAGDQTRTEPSRTVNESTFMFSSLCSSSSCCCRLFSLSIEHTPQWATTTTNKAADIKEPMEQSRQAA